MTTVGFAGLGIMGRAMALNLISAGFDTIVWNRTAAKTVDLAARGAAVATSASELASRCDVVMMCVSDTSDVEEVVFGEQGVAAGLRPDCLIIDHSTISPEATKRFAATVTEAGAHWLDAPVSGGAEGAARGTLSIMVGGDAGQLERAMPYLTAVGSTITHIGPTGSGQLAKAVNQILVVLNQLAVSEALLLADAGGLDLDTTLRAVESGAAGSWMLSNRGPQMIKRDWRPGFTIDLQQKDLRLVLDAADSLGVPIPGTSLVFQLYRALQERGLGSEGNHALVKALEAMAGIKLGADE
ncbi:MAG: NAD(P)-dependent oxidoreductase [Actinomycetota bacterium]|nr:NAD(P)-dependent oxidoreductase [Actinomycetota bacterium]MDK1016562.1 NAD(P)-dependent oxidoreductase [Actinomycetota bacterium]MDK1038400.1 NAD(P)-dependent oxidoreductase [Actinomycetota bacterium]MDK1095759.1 NAD(P)-dependent oxidoreductase [Actinomycetota bacterium]